MFGKPKRVSKYRKSNGNKGEQLKQKRDDSVPNIEKHVTVNKLALSNLIS